MTLSYFTEILSNVLLKSSINRWSDNEGGLYRPQINHFLFLKFISVNIDSIVPHSRLFFLSHAK
jgi:hypothetical protein